MANTNPGTATNDTRKSTGGSPGPSHATIEAKYATHGATRISTSNGWAACSRNRDVASSEPNNKAADSAISMPR